MANAEHELLGALGKVPKALAAFEAMPSSHRERWIAYVDEARRADARARRIERCIKELSGACTGDARAGYSGTPLLMKLGIKDGHRVALVDPPKELPADLTTRPASVRVSRGARGGPFDVIVLFADRKSRLNTRFPLAACALKPDGGLWVAWPKRASGVSTDLTEDRVREIALAAGLVDNKVCALDRIWSGLRCVYRRTDRKRED